MRALFYSLKVLKSLRQVMQAPLRSYLNWSIYLVKFEYDLDVQLNFFGEAGVIFS